MKEILDYVRAVVGEHGQPPPKSLEDLQHQLQAELITQEAFTKGGLALTQYLRESGLELVPATERQEREDRIKTLVDRLAIMEGQAAAHRADQERHIAELEAAAAQPIEEPWPLMVVVMPGLSVPEPEFGGWLRFWRGHLQHYDARGIRVGSRMGIRHSQQVDGKPQPFVLWGTLTNRAGGQDLDDYETWWFERDALPDGSDLPDLPPRIEEESLALIYIAEEPAESLTLTGEIGVYPSSLIYPVQRSAWQVNPDNLVSRLWGQTGEHEDDDRNNDKEPKG